MSKRSQAPRYSQAIADLNDPAVLHWTEALTGLRADRVAVARERVARWNFQHVVDELLAPTIDACVGATFLVEGFDALVSNGVDERQLLKKIRQDRGVWGTWAEIRAADILLRSLEDARLTLEEGRSKGAHADLRFLLPEDGDARSVEVKAIGLSDDEVAFCERMAASLKSLLPKTGLGHIHAPLDGQPPRKPREIRKAGHSKAKTGTKITPHFPPGLRGAVIVGHGSENAYARRVAGRVVQAVRQLPADDDCWVAILWSNGAPVVDVAAAVPWRDVPQHVTGIVLVGSGVAFPDRNIHVYTYPIHRDADLSAEPDLYSLDGPEMVPLARAIHHRFQRSSGVRPTLLKGGQRTVLLRDGSRRILPFNLLLDADPPEVDRSHPDLWQATVGPGFP